MIGFNNLGTMGRFGNQMFQYATIKGIASNRGFEYTIPPMIDKKIQHHNYGLIEAFELKTNKNIGWLQSERVVSEEGFHFNENIFNSCEDNVNLLGFFQSEKYFKHIEEDIRADFTFQNYILEPCLEMINSFDQLPIFLHVRRGDPTLDDRGFKWAYTECSDQHPPQPLSYYEQSLKYFSEDVPVIVFSDSPDWVKSQELFSDDRFFVSVPTDKYSDGSYIPYIDVCLMSLCSGAIISNSTLSWWGAWLQNTPNKKVIAPKMWFGSAYSSHNTKDLYCDDWIVI